MKYYLISFLHCLFFLNPLFSSDISIMTMAIGEDYKKAVRTGIENKKEYCNLHGYKFICEESAPDKSREITWGKIPLVLKEMENEDCKWIFWTDADSLIMNYAIKLEDIIDEQYDFIISKDLNGFNAGHFIIRNCEWSRNFFEKVYAQGDVLKLGFHEQGVIAYEIDHDADTSAHTKIIPQRLINSYPEEIVGITLNSTFRKGDFIVHFAGIRFTESLDKMFKKYNQKVVNSTDYLNYSNYLNMHGIISPPEKYLDHENKRNLFSKALQPYKKI